MIRMLTSILNLCVRCLTAAAPSCPTSTRQLTRSTDRRDWLSPLTDTLWSPIPGTTALKSTATCSSGSSPSARQLCTARDHTLSPAPWGAQQTLADFALVHPPVSHPVIVPSVWLTSTHLSAASLPKDERKVKLWVVVTVLCPWWITLEESFVLFPNPPRRQLVCDTKTLCSYLLLNFEGLGCFIVGCSVFWRCGM